MKGPLAAAAVAAALVTALGSRAPRAPNIVLIVIDTLRKDHLPFYGYPKQTAPFLSRLARTGVVFDSAYSTSTWTAPAAASIFTSLYPFQHGVVSGLGVTRRRQRADASIELNRVPEAAETLGEAMQRAGYATYAVTDNVNLSRELGFAQGFDHFKNFTRTKSAEVVNGKLLEWREQILAERRYFLYLHYVDPHGPYEPRAPWFDPTLTGLAREVSAYDSEIAYVDARIAEAAAALRWDRDTLILVSADHGEEFLDHNFAGHGHTLYAEVVNVPLLVAFPGVAHAGRRVAEPVSHIDLLPTLREAAGLAPDPANEGISLLPLAAGGKGPERMLYGHLFRKNDEGGPDKLLRYALAGEWKLIAGSQRGPLLFNLREDPRETHSLAAERPQVVQALEQRLLAFERSCRRFAGERQAITIDDATREELKTLGYVN